MKTRAYADFSLAVHNASVCRRMPLSGVIEATRRCPMNCLHCYNNLPIADGRARAGELTASEHRRILDEIAEAGCLWLLYTGGEPFARRDFLEIYLYARSKGILITLFTNATTVTDEIARTLGRYPPFSVEVTLYGRTRETFERVTRAPGSFDRCMRGIERLMANRVPLQLKAVALTLNKHELGDMKRFAEEEVGVNFRFDAQMNPRLDCSAAPLAVRLSPAEVVELDLRDPARASEWRSYCERFNGPLGSPDGGNGRYHCGAGISSFAIDPEGRLTLCALSQTEAYDLRQGSFREGWGEFLLRARHTKATRSSRCVTCAIKAMCGACAATSYLEAGDPDAPVDFLCEVAHLRAFALGQMVAGHGPCAFCPGGERYDEIVRLAASLALEAASARTGTSSVGRGRCAGASCAACTPDDAEPALPRPVHEDDGRFIAIVR